MMFALFEYRITVIKKRDFQEKNKKYTSSIIIELIGRIFYLESILAREIFHTNIRIYTYVIVTSNMILLLLKTRNSDGTFEKLVLR